MGVRLGVVLADQPQAPLERPPPLFSVQRRVPETASNLSADPLTQSPENRGELSAGECSYVVVLKLRPNAVWNSIQLRSSGRPNGDGDGCGFAGAWATAAAASSRSIIRATGGAGEAGRPPPAGQQAQRIGNCMTIWVALDPVTQETGALRHLPGSYLEDLRPGAPQARGGRLKSTPLGHKSILGS